MAGYFGADEVAESKSDQVTGEIPLTASATVPWQQVCD